MINGMFVLNSLYTKFVLQKKNMKLFLINKNGGTKNEIFDNQYG